MKRRSSFVLYADNSYAAHKLLYAPDFPIHHSFFHSTPPPIKAPNPWLIFTLCFITACHLPMLKRHTRKMKQYALLPISLNSGSWINVCNLHSKMPVLVPSKEPLSMCEVSLMSLTLIKNCGGESRIAHQCFVPHSMRMYGDCTELPDSRFPGGKPQQANTVAEYTGKCSQRP